MLLFRSKDKTSTSLIHPLVIPRWKFSLVTSTTTTTLEAKSSASGRRCIRFSPRRTLSPELFSKRIKLLHLALSRLRQRLVTEIANNSGLNTNRNDRLARQSLTQSSTTTETRGSKSLLVLSRSRSKASRWSTTALIRPKSLTFKAQILPRSAFYPSARGSRSRLDPTPAFRRV